MELWLLHHMSNLMDVDFEIRYMYGNTEPEC